MERDEKFMKQCIVLAGQALKYGKTPVGSIIVKNDEILSEGIEGDNRLPEMMAHAEMIAVLDATERTASKDLSGCTLYTTVEPCYMCSYLIRSSGISRIVYGIPTHETGGATSAFPFLLSNDFERWKAAPKVTAGVLEKECEALMKRK